MTIMSLRGSGRFWQVLLLSTGVLVLGLASFFIFVAASVPATSSPRVDLAGPFPDTIDTGNDVLHMRVVSLDVDTQLSNQSDFWFQPSTKRFRFEERSDSSSIVAVRVLTDSRLMSYNVRTGIGADYSIAAYLKSAARYDYDPLSADANDIAKLARDVSDKLAAKMLVEVSRETRDGRESIIYEGRQATHPGSQLKWGTAVVDVKTGLPLQDSLVDVDGGNVCVTYLRDYEVLTLASAEVDTLFSLSIPAGTNVLQDSDLPVDPETFKVTAQEAANAVSFDLHWLGESFQDLPLRTVAKQPDNSQVSMVYALRTAGEAPQPTGNEVLMIYQFDSATGAGFKEALIKGLQGSGATAREIASTRGTTYTIWSGGSLAPTLLLERSGTTIAIADEAGPDAVATLLRAAGSLTEVTK